MSQPYAAKLRTLSFGRPEARKAKRTTDLHDSHAVTVTEHWDDRVDVSVHGLPTVHTDIRA